MGNSAASGRGTGADGSVYAAAWEKILKRLIAEFGQSVFESWFARLKFDGVENGVAILSVPTPFLRSWIRDNYLTRINAMWTEERNDISGSDLRLRRPGQAVVQKVAQSAAIKEAASAAASRNSASRNAAARDMSGARDSIPLDSRLTFDQFVAAPTNTLARAAAIEVAGAVDAAGAALQPAVHPRRRWTRQDAPAARHRLGRAQAPPEPQGAPCCRRTCSC